jgi:hypothetical protein
MIKKWSQNPSKITPKIDAKKDEKKEIIKHHDREPGRVRSFAKPNHFKRHPSE